MTLDDLDFLPQGTPGLNIQAFDCGRKSVNDFFHNDYSLSLSQVPTYNSNSFNTARAGVKTYGFSCYKAREAALFFSVNQ